MLGDLTDATGHQQLLKFISRMSPVRHLCAKPGLSRVELAAAVGLTKSTVSMPVRELIAEAVRSARFGADAVVVCAAGFFARDRRTRPLIAPNASQRAGINTETH